MTLKNVMHAILLLPRCGASHVCDGSGLCLRRAVGSLVGLAEDAFCVRSPPMLSLRNCAWQRHGIRTFFTADRNQRTFRHLISVSGVAVDETDEFVLSRSSSEESTDKLDESPLKRDDVADFFNVAASQGCIG